MNEMQIFSKPEFGRVGALTAQDGTPWFNAVDVCRVLGYKNVTDILKKHVDEADLSKREARSGGQIREMNFVNESGLYSLVFGSKMPNAKAFKRWVTSEVLPSLRKHGMYLTPEALRQSMKDPKFLETALRQLSEEQEKNAQLRTQIQADRPRVLFSKAVERATNSILVRDMARVLRQNGVEIGEKRLYQWLRDHGYLCTFGTSYNRPTQWAMDKGLFQIKETPMVKSDGTEWTAYTTLVTGRGQVYFVNAFVHMTEQELEVLKESECAC